MIRNKVVHVLCLPCTYLFRCKGTIPGARHCKRVLLRSLQPCQWTEWLGFGCIWRREYEEGVWSWLCFFQLPWGNPCECPHCQMTSWCLGAQALSKRYGCLGEKNMKKDWFAKAFSFALYQPQIFTEARRRKRRASFFFFPLPNVWLFRTQVQHLEVRYTESNLWSVKELKYSVSFSGNSTFWEWILTLLNTPTPRHKAGNSEIAFASLN